MFQDQTFELYIKDSETGREVQLYGSTKHLDNEEKDILDRLMPGCVFTKYEQR
ncbi:hypothetical protein [Caulobacter phage Cr30]|uniref:hypothetical protein n=1 Tax=Caulobacter phage Cr30 TaxID=1357714 RepID=UPI0004A9B843|nr:hypothetical protein OZ74_gp015 [Caulobacter phage Cr30]AGS80900.1 hypothetical protein [Caulobacter phage Cr30]